MNCDKYFELMSAALDGECTPEERRELDGHLAVCPECARSFRILSANSQAVRELDCEVPADLKARIMSSLPQQEASAKRGKVIHWKRWVPVAAAACLVLVISLIPGSFNGAAPSAADQDGSVTYGMYDAAEAPQTNGSKAAESAPTPQAVSESESAHCAMSDPQAIRVSYGATPQPGAVVIGSVDSLREYLSGFGSLAWDQNGDPIPIPELEKLAETCTGEFFTTRRLLCVVVESGSGSNRFELAPQGLSLNSVTVLEHIPETGTCDMAAWLLVAEVDTLFRDGDTLEVNFVR